MSRRSKKASRELLLELYRLLLVRLIEKLESPDVRASTMEVARHVLHNAGIFTEARDAADAKRALEGLKRETEGTGDLTLPFPVAKYEQ